MNEDYRTSGMAGISLKLSSSLFRIVY